MGRRGDLSAPLRMSPPPSRRAASRRGIDVVDPAPVLPLRRREGKRTSRERAAASPRRPIKVLRIRTRAQSSPCIALMRGPKRTRDAESVHRQPPPYHRRSCQCPPRLQGRRDRPRCSGQCGEGAGCGALGELRIEPEAATARVARVRTPGLRRQNARSNAFS